MLDENVLIPAGLRDVMLSCADVGVFRPVWHAEIEDVVVGATARLTAERRGMDLDQARAGAEATMSQMRRAFACSPAKGPLRAVHVAGTANVA